MDTDELAKISVPPDKLAKVIEAAITAGLLELMSVESTGYPVDRMAAIEASLSNIGSNLASLVTRIEYDQPRRALESFDSIAHSLRVLAGIAEKLYGPVESRGY